MTRAGLRPVARQTRAYFAPVNRVSGATAVFDPSQNSGFQLDAPAAPWIDLGWIENFQRTSTSQIEALASGAAGAVAAQARQALGARIDFEFRDWGKLQMALSGGAEHMNVLATDPSASPVGSGGIPLTAVPLLAGSTAVELVVGAGAVAGFQPGGLRGMRCRLRAGSWVCGYGDRGRVCRGSGRCAARRQLCAAGDVQCRASCAGYGHVIVADTGIAWRSASSGGGGAAGCRFRRPRWRSVSATVVGTVCGRGRVRRTRVFLLSDFESVHGEGGMGAGDSGRDSKNQSRSWALQASFTALPTVDINDGAVVLCYRSYFPGSGAAVY